MRLRHGGHWLFAGDDPRGWRLGFSKIMLEVVPHLFAEQLLRMGQGSVKKLLAEIERIRVGHDEQKERDNGKEMDRFTPQHYVRMHTMPLGQWMVMDFKYLDEYVEQGATSTTWSPRCQAQGERLGAGNQASGRRRSPRRFTKPIRKSRLVSRPVIAGYLRRLRRSSRCVARPRPIAMDILESLVMPTIHIGLPESFPELDEDDISRLHKGIELFALFVDVVPHQHQAWDDGFLGTIPNEDLATPYRDKTKLEIGKGDWVIVNPKRFVEMLSGLLSRSTPRALRRFRRST